MLIVNISVWKNLDSLKNYVYKSIHVDLIRGKDAWFNKISNSHLALWWVPAGHIPTVVEGKEKLNYLQKHGASEIAFTFSKYYDHEN